MSSGTSENTGHPAVASTAQRWGFEAVFDGGTLAVSVAVGRDLATGRGWYRAVVAGVGRRPVVVVDPDLALPSQRASLEFRAPGLWCDHAADRPLPAWPSTPTPPGGEAGPWPHWTLGAEAFGIAVDDPWEVWGRGYGERTPVGLDLSIDVVAAPGGGPWHVAAGIADGEVLIADERHEVHGPAVATYEEGDVPTVAPGRWRRWWPSGVTTRESAVGPLGDGPPEGVVGAVGVIDGPHGPMAVGVAGAGEPNAGWVTWRPTEDYSE